MSFSYGTENMNPWRIDLDRIRTLKIFTRKTKKDFVVTEPDEQTKEVLRKLEHVRARSYIHLNIPR